MGTADVVPGVSGGTIALILGIYERLVHSIKAVAGAAFGLLRRDRSGALTSWREVDWSLVVPLVIGIGAAIISLARLLEYLLDREPEALSGFFFGLVAASIVIVWRLIRRPLPVHIPIALAVAVAAFFLLSLRGGAVEDPGLLATFGSGMIAICAMILPGISGSFILLMLGMYDAIIAAVNDRDFGLLAVFAAGAALGLGLFAWLLDWLLRHYHDLLMAALAGLMLGSLRVLWPWPEGTDSAAVEAPPSSGWVVPLVVGLAGAAIVLWLAWFSRRRESAGGSETASG